MKMLAIGFAVITVAILALFNCSGNTIPPPSAGQWTCFKCSGMTVNGDGSFTFPDSGGVVGYIYTARTAKLGQTVSLTFSLAGNGAVVPSPASGPGQPQLRLFLWGKGDDLSCAGSMVNARWWSNPNAAVLQSPMTLVPLTAALDPAQWTNCIGQHDLAGFNSTVNNLLGVGFTFGAEFFGHGVFANGPVNFKINKFSVQ